MPIKNMGSTTMRFNEGIIVSGTAGSDTGTLLVTGSVYVTGSNSFRALDVYANISNDYVVAIDNDAGSSGHGLKVTTDGTGTGTTILDLEAGSTTVFKVRGDGRVGIGVDTPGSTLSVDDEIAVGEKLVHRGDPNTYLQFPSNDNITFAAGGSEELKIASDAILVKQYIKHDGDVNTWINFSDNRIRLNAGGNNFIDCEDPGSAPHKVRINNGGNNIDFVIKDNNGSVYFTADASTARIGIGTDTPIAKLDVNGKINSSGDLYVSGNLYVVDTAGLYADKIRRRSDSDNTTKILLNDELLKFYAGHSSNDIVRIGETNYGDDNNFWVSGSIGSKGTATRGTAIFGGDLVVSGALHAAGEGIIVSGAFGSTYALHASGTVEAENLFLDDVEPAIQFKEGGSDRAEIQINDSDNLLITNQSINKFIVFKTNDAGNIREGLRIGGTVPEVVVNEGADSLIDFRVESDNNTHMLFVDGGNEKIGIKDSTPTSTLTVNGSISLAVRKIDAANDPGTTFTIPDTDCVVLVNTRPTAQNGIDSAITLTLPDASDNPGMVLTIKDSAGYADVNSITISASSGDNIDGNPSTTSIDLPTPASFKKLISDGVNSWYEIGS